MSEQRNFVVNRYAGYLQQRKAQVQGQKPGFWNSFAKRTSLRVKQFFNQPVESALYYTFSALPVPGLSEQDVAQVTSYVSQKFLGGKGFEAPHAPSAREEALLKSTATREFRRFLSQDPQARTAFVQHYQNEYGRVPIEVHKMLPRPAMKISLHPDHPNRINTAAILQRIRGNKPLVFSKKPAAQKPASFEPRAPTVSPHKYRLGFQH